MHTDSITLLGAFRAFVHAQPGASMVVALEKGPPLAGAVTHFGGDIYVSRGVDTDGGRYRTFFDAKSIFWFEISDAAEQVGALSPTDLEELLKG